ncbi:MAG TPA: NAD(P)-binding protein [Candidatus Dormibacteraeota bacterium]|jgi:2-polyprenyl-6-methoxyphenol hydroxylase-like FAD-dependent oxidoreductase
MRIVVVGGSLAGLATALLLARNGHELVVLDRDDIRPAPDIEAAAASAFRIGAPQVVQGHGYLPGGRRLLREHLPDVYSALLESGVEELHLPSRMPPTIADRSPQPGDDDLVSLCSRRSTVDLVFRRAASTEPGLDLLPGSAATGLITVSDGAGIPRVSGLMTDLLPRPSVHGVTRLSLTLHVADGRQPRSLDRL